MSETAARQCDRVLPAVPYRQWVLSLPWELRLPVARDPALLNAVSRVFFEEVREWLRAAIGAVPGAKLEACAVSGRGSPAIASSGANTSAVASSTTHEREPPRAPIDARGDGEGVRRAERAVRPAVGSEVPDATHDAYPLGFIRVGVVQRSRGVQEAGDCRHRATVLRQRSPRVAAHLRDPRRDGVELRDPLLLPTIRR